MALKCIIGYLLMTISMVTSFRQDTLMFPRDDLRYGIIIDAGSTQTRLYIYKFHGPSNASYSPHVEPALINGTEEQAKYIKDGSITDHKPKHIPEFFIVLLNYAKSYIPDYMHSSTTLHVLATAGVRLLDRSKMILLVETISAYLSHKPNSPFKFDPDFGVEVLPGEFEGAFDWLTVNYLAGTLRKEESDKTGIISIDFGGASIEVTFEPTELLLEGSFPLRVNGTDRILYTQSYLQFGRNQALQRHREMLARKALEGNDIGLNKKLKVNDPCFPIGYDEKFKVKSLKKKFRFIGTNNYSLCQILTRDLLRQNVFCAAEPCSMNGKYQPPLPLNRPIYGTDTFAKLAEILQCPPKTTLNCLEQKALIHCSSSSLTYSPFLKVSDCFLSAYATNILRYGLKIDPFRELHLTDEYNGISIGWTLGAMIYQLEIDSFKDGYCGISQFNK